MKQGSNPQKNKIRKSFENNEQEQDMQKKEVAFKWH